MPRTPLRAPTALGAVLVALAAAAIPAAAQTARPVPSAPPAAPTPATPTPAGEAEQTTAAFGDWLLRCVRGEGSPAARQCEITLGVQADIQAGPQAPVQRQTVLQVAVGRTAQGAPWRMTLVVPVNVELTAPPRFETEPSPEIALAWQRCLPFGCFASADLAPEALARLRGRADPARITLKDGAGRDAAIPISLRGFAPAFEALGRE